MAVLANFGFLIKLPLRMISFISSFQFVSNANPKSTAERRKFWSYTSRWSQPCWCISSIPKTISAWPSMKTFGEWVSRSKLDGAIVGGTAASSQSIRNHLCGASRLRMILGQRISRWKTWGSSWRTLRACNTHTTAFTNAYHPEACSDREP